MIIKPVHEVLGKNTVRSDGLAKVTGREKFTSDLSLRNMLHVRVLKSSHAHAEVLNIDTSGAQKLGATVLTVDEVPDVMFCPRLVSTPDSTYKDWRILTDHPRYVGEAIAAVAAETEEDAQKALEAMEVEYKTHPAYFDPLTSHEKGATQIHEHIILEDNEIKPERNVGCELHIKEGDVEEALKTCDVVLERTYTTNRRYHTQLETKSVVVRPEIDGGVTIWSTTQTLHNSRLLLHEIFGLPMGKIRIIKVPLGGSFGSSIQVNTVVPIAVAMALKTKRPVKLTYTREEDARDHVSYGMVFKIKLGVKTNGKLVAGHLDVYLDIGAHQIQAFPLLGCMVGWWVSLYKLEAKSYDSYAIYTNKTPACAFRGYGNPQISWMVETMMDELAEKIDMDPVEFRLKNIIGQGDLFWGQGPSVKSLIKSCGTEEILARGAELSGWYNRPKAEDQTGRYRRGIGMGGTVDYITALMDHGGGTEDAHAKIIAETLCIPLENVNIIRADTSTTVYDVCTHASRGIYSGGGAALKVAKQLKTQISQFAGRMLDAEASALSFRCDYEKKQGVIFAEGIENREVTFKELAYNARHKNWGTPAVVDSYRQPSCPPHFTGYFIEVEVDTWTGKVRLIKVIAGADVGTVINPKLAAGQVHGGFAQGWGLTVMEDMDYDHETGDLINKGMLTDCKVPYTCDMPDLDDFVVFFADTYEPTGPYGAKGLGEGALNPVAGAIANAIQNALGIRFYKLPLTKERILEAIMEKEG
jgi:xanthine dehydrogenase molybdenum-binding subunit